MSDILNLVKNLCAYETEREWFEFKVNWFEPVQLGEYISAISNSAALEGCETGYFVWGIDDRSHDIAGTTFSPDVNVKGEPLKHFLARQIFPDLNFTFEETQVEGKRIVVLKIPSAKTVPASFANERFIRIGSSKENLKKFPEKESYLFDVLRHGFPTIENTESEFQDLTFEKLFIYYGAKGLKLNEETFKKNLELLTRNGKYNILAQLLSDNSHVPIRVSIFSGKTKSSTLFSVREFGYQCILYSLDEVLRYGDVLNIIQADEKNRVVERREVSLFENDAFREAIINAFIHNKWVSLNEPMITVFSDRIEILSRGTLPPEQTLEGFFAGESIPVNKKLSEIFLQLHISEKTGRGVPKITEKYGRSVYEFRENSIVVKIPFKWINEMNNQTSTESEKSSSGQSNAEESSSYLELNSTQEKIIKLMKENPRISINMIASSTEKSVSAVKKAISSLKQNGYIERLGNNKDGSWKVLK